jgi:hypothetical protein
MVRLIHKKKTRKRTSRKRSQFHYGSINTIEKKLNTIIGNSSQFHYGSINTREDWRNDFIVMKVSIPLWFD